MGRASRPRTAPVTMGDKYASTSAAATNKQKLVWLLLAVCVFMTTKIYLKWSTPKTRVVRHAGSATGIQEAFNNVYERIDVLEERVAALSQAQAQTTERLKNLKGKGKKGFEEENRGPRNNFYLSQVKPGDICIFKATEREESLVGNLGERTTVSYANHLGEVYEFTDSESGKTAFQRSSILAMMRSYKNGKFQMQSNKKGRVIPKWYGDFCNHQNVIESPTGEKSAYGGRPCSTCIPWLLTLGIKEFNLLGLEDDQGLWLEFGTRIGDTTKHLYKLRKGKGPIYTFDSFLGLPETVDTVNTPFREGKYAMNSDSVALLSGWEAVPEGGSAWNSLRIPESVKVVQGWFNETVEGFLEEHSGEPIRLVHIDSSIYSSAAEVFNALAGHVRPGTVVVFNEYTYCRDQDAYIADIAAKAFFEFLAKTGLGAQILGSTKYSGAWILLDREELPTWLRENKNKYQVQQGGEGSQAVGEARAEDASQYIEEDRPGQDNGGDEEGDDDEEGDAVE